MLTFNSVPPRPDQKSRHSDSVIHVSTHTMGETMGRCPEVGWRVHTEQHVINDGAYAGIMERNSFPTCNHVVSSSSDSLNFNTACQALAKGYFLALLFSKPWAIKNFLMVNITSSYKSLEGSLITTITMGVCIRHHVAACTWRSECL